MTEQHPELRNLTALLEEHGIVPEQGTEERPGESWGLPHRYVYQEVEKRPDFPMTAEKVREILEYRSGSERD